MHRLHIADPAEFFRLPDEWQRLHLEHVRCHLIGRYTPDPTRSPPRPPGAGRANPDTLAQINRWRQRQQQQPRGRRR